MKSITILSTLLAATVLVACGGGGSSAPTPTPATGVIAPVAEVADKYVGTWISCTPDPIGNVSAKDINIFTKSTATSLSVIGHYDYYAGQVCAGSPTSVNQSTGVFSIVGTKVIGTITVDLIDTMVATPIVETQKSIAYVNGNSMQATNAKLSPVDANGYPTVLSATSLPLIKQ